MEGLFTANKEQEVQRSPKRLVGLLFSFLFFFLLQVSANACTIGAPAGDDKPAPGSMIQVTGHSIKGNFLVITYSIEFPGMTKVKLFNGAHELLWRSQYVNDKIGDHELVVRTSALNIGSSYVFEFDYKNHIRNYPISM